MAFVVKDRVKETTTTQGTGTLTLDGAATGFQGFTAIGDGNTTYYTISGGSQWEVGIGIYTASGTTLSRDTVLASSNNGNLVNLSAGSKDVFVVYPSGRAVIVNGTTIEVPNSAVLPVAAGGTGSATASFSGANITSLNANNVSSGILAVAQGGTGSATAAFSGANITSLNANNVSTGILAVAQGGTGSATASFSGANITSINANNISSGVLAVAQGGTGSNSATFSGANITSINASNISSGTLDNARTSASSSNGASTIVARDAAGSFAGNVITANQGVITTVNATTVNVATLEGNLSGSGANLTSLNASNISSGTIANARTTATATNGASTIVSRDGSGNFAGGTITGATFSGSGASLTSLNASSISSGTLDNARTSASSSNGASTIVARDASGNFTAATITATTFSGSGASLTSLNASNISAGTLAVARGGTGSGTTPTNGQLLIGNGSGFTLATITQGTGITVGTGAGSTTITNAGVTSVAGTSNQISVSGSTGAVTFSTPQSIATGSSVQFGSFGVGTAASGTTGEIRATNNVTAYYSDDRLKTKLGNIESALEKLCSLSGFYYEANETAQALGYDAIKEVGLSAQEVQKVLPEIVVPAPIDAQYLTIRYEKLAPLIVEAIKELKAEVDKLKAR